MKQMLHKGIIPLMVVVITALTGWTGVCRAAGFFTFDDMEKPKPEFTRSDGEISAKLIPRAKSTSVVIRFAVPSGGRLAEVRGVDFQTVDRPEVDVKNFKSAAFEIRITDVTPGGEADVAIRSDFFTASTAFYVFNPGLASPWIIPKVLNAALPDRVRELQLRVADGGELDGDGLADGRITLIGGPRDSFWGYALGTLFIRFFGIFIVLSFLMIGMLVSGVVFRWHEKRRRPANDAVGTAADHGDAAAGAAAPDLAGEEVSAEELAAIGVALHLEFNCRRGLAPVLAAAPQAAVWAASGRQRIMNDRLLVFNRSHRWDK